MVTRKPLRPRESSLSARTMVDGTEYALGSLTGSLGFLTRVVQVQLNDQVRAIGGLSISNAAFATLRLVEANPGIRQVDVARLLMIQESNMANLIKDLTSNALMEKRGEAGGKRGGLQITDSGRLKLKQTAPANTLERACAAALSDKEYRELLALLTKIYQASLRGPKQSEGSDHKLHPQQVNPQLREAADRRASGTESK